MFGINLAVNQFNSLPLQLLYIENKGVFAGVAHGAEHTLAKEDLPDADTVEPADEGRIFPDFGAMGVAGQMQANISFADFVRDPGAFLPSPGDRLALADDLPEIGVDPELKSISADELAHAARRLGELTPAQREIVDHFSRSLMNKFLHAPSARLRAAAANGRGLGVVDTARYLFGLDETPPAAADASEQGRERGAGAGERAGEGPASEAR